ncbi:MAG: hypothetical protein KF819_37450 [Labilithrix sp.]|nr:hypothetical protein [Labilithrix sp.]
MKRRSWCSLVASFMIVACGGRVSLGEIAGDGGDDRDVGDGGPCSAKAACGPETGVAAIACIDGQIGMDCWWTGAACIWLPLCAPPPPCFIDDSLNPEYKKCATSADCVTTEYKVDCCGRLHVAGVSARRSSNGCAARRAADLPECGNCPAKASIADDGTTAPSVGAQAAVACDAGLCQTSFTGD